MVRIVYLASHVAARFCILFPCGSAAPNGEYRINFSILHTLLLEVVFMDRDFRVADLSAEKVAEINEFQKKLRNETNQNIVLIAYEPGTTK